MNYTDVLHPPRTCHRCIAANKQRAVAEILADVGQQNKTFNSMNVNSYYINLAFRALTLLVGQQEGHPACKKWGDGGGGHWLVRNLDGVAPSWMVSVSASVDLPLHHNVQKFSYGTGSPRWSRKKGPYCSCGYYIKMRENLSRMIVISKLGYVLQFTSSLLINWAFGHWALKDIPA